MLFIMVQEFFYTFHFHRPPDFFNCSLARISKVSVCLFVQLLQPNCSRIFLHTVYSNYPPLGQCFKTKNILTHRPNHFQTYLKSVSHPKIPLQRPQKEDFKKSKQIDPPTLFLPHLKIGPGASNDQKLVILSYIIGKSMKRRFQKGQKNFHLPHPLLAQPKNKS